jgi:uncharacterized membrane protein
MKNKNLMIIVGIIVLVVVGGIILINYYGKEDETQNGNMLVSDAGVAYDKEIEEYFNDQTLVQELISRPIRSHAISLEVIDNETWVSVIIDLKDFSEAEDLLSIFSDNEIKDISFGNLSKSIGADLTKEGFDKLIQDERVDKVYYSHPMYLLDERNIIDSYKYFILGIMAVIIVILLIVVVFFIFKEKNQRRKKN